MIGNTHQARLGKRAELAQYTVDFAAPQRRLAILGLNRTGDSLETYFTVQTLANAMQKMGVLISPGTKEDFKKMPDVHVKEYVAHKAILTIATSANA